MTDLEFVECHHPSNTQQEDNGGTVPIRLPTVEDGEPFFESAAIYKAARAARERFFIVELGGGYAAHSVDAHQAPQDLNSMPCQLVIVEAAPTTTHGCSCGAPGSSITGWPCPRILMELSNKSSTGTAVRWC